MELKSRAGSPATITSGVIVQSALVPSVSQPEPTGADSAASSSLLAGAGASSASPLASAVGPVGGHLSERPQVDVSGGASSAKVHGKGSPSIVTPVKSASVSSAGGSATSCIPSPILSPPGKIFGRNNNGIIGKVRYETVRFVREDSSHNRTTILRCV
uniref:Uncharacterized protein n=1 Tax=Anopheles farauti TaxID=69004 RepID=A0A182Q1G2_9DIPT